VHVAENQRCAFQINLKKFFKYTKWLHLISFLNFKDRIYLKKMFLSGYEGYPNIRNFPYHRFAYQGDE